MKRFLAKLCMKKKKREWGRCPKCSSTLIVEKTKVSSCKENIDIIPHYNNEQKDRLPDVPNDGLELQEMFFVEAIKASVTVPSMKKHLTLTSINQTDQDTITNNSNVSESPSPSPMPTVGLLSLPVEILFTIVMYIPQDGTLAALKSSCAFFHSLLEDEMVWGRSELCIKVDVRWGLIDRVLITSHNLNSIDFSNCTAITDHLITAVVTAHPELSHVNISGCVLITDLSLSQLQLSVMALEHLNISRCCLVTCDAVFGVARKHNSTLRYLNINECLGMAYDPYKVSRLAEHCVNLRHLAFGWSRRAVGLNPILDNDVVKFAVLCPKLISLDLSCARLSDSGIDAVAQNCKLLSDLTLSHSCIKDTGLTILAHHLLLLQVLDISDCSYITDKGIQAIATMLHSLRMLDVSRCFNITDNGMTLLLNNLTLLRELTIVGCFRITDRSMKHACDNCTSLHFINMCSTMVSIQALEHLKKTASLCLKVLVEDCPFVQYEYLAKEVLIDTTQWPPSVIERPRQWMESAI